MKRMKFFEYLAPIKDYSIRMPENREWDITAFVIYNPTRKRLEEQKDPPSGCYQMFWPANPWSAFGA